MRKRNVLLLLLTLICAIPVWGQRTLSYKDVSSGMNVFSGKDDEAGMVFFCPTTIPLTFESSMDREVDVYQTEQKADKTAYYIRFQVGRKYRGRKLTVNAPGFSPLLFEVDLAPKELKQYSLFDPDEAFVYGCYYEYRKRGADYFQQGMYEEAREQYATAKECSDCPADSDLDTRIADIDSIGVYLHQADSLKNLLDYKGASDCYLKVLLFNPGDKAVQAKRLETERQFSNDCNRYAASADAYYQDGDLEKALELYQRVLDMNCFNGSAVATWVNIIQKNLSAQKQKARVLLYEYGFDQTPFGFSTGRYKDKRVGGYFGMAFGQLIKAFDKKSADVNDFEIGLSTGITFRPIKAVPIWGTFGIAFSVNGAFRVDEEENSSYDTYPSYEESAEPGEEDLVLQPFPAIGPEVGLLAKLKFIAIRYTFQYRLPISDEQADKDMFNKAKHTVGLGFCF